MLFSVFTHMLEDEIRHYLAEIRRMLGRGDIAVATFFLMDSSRIDRQHGRLHRRRASLRNIDAYEAFAYLRPLGTRKGIDARAGR